MGTLSKAIGGYGGYLCASPGGDRSDHNRARTLRLFDRPAAGDAPPRRIAALDMIEREPGFVRRAAGQGAAVHPRRSTCPRRTSPIVPVVIGEAEAALAASRCWSDEGFLVVAIRPPTVPAGTARLRFAFTARHPDAEIERLAGRVPAAVLA